MSGSLDIVAASSAAPGQGQLRTPTVRAAAALLLLGLLVWMVLPRPSGDGGHALQPTRASGGPQQGISALPLALSAPMSRALGAADRAYRIGSSAAPGLRAVSPAQRLGMHFERSGVILSSGAARLGLRLGAVGSPGALQPVGEVAPTARANRAVYSHGLVREWYLNGPLGLEQGFTVAHAPSAGAAGSLELSIALSGNMHARLGASGTLQLSGPSGSRLRYGELRASDASGRVLPSRLTLRAGAVVLSVDTAGAHYPVSVDPLLQQGQPITAPGGTGQFFGVRVAMSADGATALISVQEPELSSGAAFVFVRQGASWSEQAELTGSGAGTEACATEDSDCLWRSVALSGDGDTAIIGAPLAAEGHGMAFLFTRTGATWSQQGPPVTGAGEWGRSHFGRTVALSADGSTALVGGPSDHVQSGAVWVFTRSEGTWSQQGEKLTGNGESGEGYFGGDLALSGDGSTALIGAPGDAEKAGAAWVFTRSGTTWTGPEQKLTGGAEEAGGAGHFGSSVALSAGGTEALVGARSDEEGKGAVWAFANSGFAWIQQGHKFTGGEEVGPGEFGYAIGLSADGQTALIGGPRDNSHAGAVWLFQRSSETWAQAQEKGTGAEETNAGWFGGSVALSAGGQNALIGGSRDALKAGAAWSFAASSTSATPPTVTSVAPSSGSSSGGTAVTIRGTGFLPGAGVTIGATAGEVAYVSETELTAVTAAHAAGPVPVVVSDADGTSSGGPTFIYEAGGAPGGAHTNVLGPGASGVLSDVSVQAPLPVLGISGNIAPVSGRVYVRLPGSKTFSLLTGLREIPFGTIINATHGRVTVTTIGPGGKPQTISFYSGEFVLTQNRKGQVIATLYGGNFRACPTATERAHLARASSTHASKSHVVRKLWASGHGSYTTKGNYASGAVLGTIWFTEDLCDGTLIYVATDKVLVRNLLTHHHYVVRAGHRYFAKAR
jgi:IPT/TIG domain/FG-GAP repeat